jgi:hypothetical protein
MKGYEKGNIPTQGSHKPYPQSPGQLGNKKKLDKSKTINLDMIVPVVMPKGKNKLGKVTGY